MNRKMKKYIMLINAICIVAAVSAGVFAGEAYAASPYSSSTSVVGAYYRMPPGPVIESSNGYLAYDKYVPYWYSNIKVITPKGGMEKGYAFCYGKLYPLYKLSFNPLLGMQEDKDYWQISTIFFGLEPPAVSPSYTYSIIAQKNGQSLVESFPLNVWK